MHRTPGPIAALALTGRTGIRLKLLAGPAIRINIVLNWFEELKEWVPVP